MDTIDSDDDGGRAPKKARTESSSVARGTPNVLRTSPRTEGHYAFISRREGPVEGPWYVLAECVDQQWMDGVWGELLKTPIGQRLVARLQGQPYESLTPEPLFQACWDWFMDRFWQPGRPPPTLSTLEFTLTADDPWRVESRHWYDAQLIPAGTLGNAITCLHTVLLRTEPFREEPQERQLANFLEVQELRPKGAIPQAALRVLHTLQDDPTPPDAEDVSMREDDAPERTPDDDPSRLLRLGHAVRQWLATRVEQLVGQLQDTLQDFWPPGGPGAGLAFAGAPFPGGVSRTPWRLYRPASTLPAAPVRYCGAPGDGHGAQRPNPLPGGHVAVFNIGQGNCNALYDTNGIILAYFDLGSPTALNSASRPGVAFVPCVCDRPVVILSHTDQDHYELGRVTAATHALTWIVPTGNGQTYGGVFGGLVASIRLAGGRIIKWAHNGPGGTMTFPWGWVERGTNAERNGGGLVAFVCVREDPAVVRARAALAALPAQVPGGAPANTALFAEPVAAALAAAQAGLAANDAALAAVRAVIAVLQGVVGVLNVTAAVNNGGGALGIGLAVFGMLLPDGIPAAAATAAIACHGAGAAAGAAGHTARVAAVHATLNALPARVLERVTAPIAPQPLGAGLTVDVSAPAGRARAAVLQVPIELAGAMAVPANTRLHAETVAAALAADRGPNLTAVDAARAALRAVIAELNAAGGGAPGRVAIINGAGAYGGINPLAGGPLTAGEAGNTAAAATASVAAGHAPTPVGQQARATAAATAFVAGGAIPPRANMIRTAQEHTDFHLTPGPSLFSPGERYVLLNGDADFDFITSLRPAAAGAELPVVVGLTAVHHGAIIVDEQGTFLEGRRIPWAPGTPASGVPAVAAAQPANSLAAAITRVTNHLNGGAVANLKTRLCHAGAAAAAAVYATDADYQNAGNAAARGTLVGGDWENLAQGVAAAVLDTLLGPAEAGEVAIAAVLGTASRVNAANAHQHALAASAAQVRLRGPANPFLEISGLLAEAVAKTGDPLAAAALAALPGEVLGGAPANTAVLAAPVAADLAVRAGAAVTAQNAARAAVRAVIAVLNGGAAAPAVVAAFNGAGALAGSNALGAPLTPARATSTAEAALEVVRVGAARVLAGTQAVAQVNATAGGIANNIVVISRSVAAALATSVAGIAAADVALAAFRASIVLSNAGFYGLAGMRSDLQQAQVALVINGGGGPAGGPGHLAMAMAAPGVPLAGPVASAVARAAIETHGVGPAASVGGHLNRGLAAATGLHSGRCKVIEDAVAAVVPALATGLVSVPTLAFAGGALGVTDANVENTATQGATHRLDGYGPAVPDTMAALRPVLARLARAARGAASTAVALGPPVVNAELNAAHASLGTGLGAGALGNLRNLVSAVMALPVNPAAGNALRTVARDAAFLAMIGEAARASGIAAPRIQAAIEAVFHDTVASAAAASQVVAGANPGRIAYSYGVMPGNVHCHPAPTLGDLGHPHPTAIAEYEARGWTMRRNTPTNANHGGRQGDATVAHLRGHASLGWDQVNDQNRAAGVVNVGACVACGQVALNA